MNESLPNTPNTSELISQSTCAEIDRWLRKYPPDKKRSALLIALRLVQEENGGWLSTARMDAVAEYLELSKTAVYEVATFYKMYDLKPVGCHKIAVCNSISCMLNGVGKILAHLEHRLGIKPGETTADGLFTLKEVECLAACVSAPVMQIDDRDYHENLTPEAVDAILDKLLEAEHSHGK